MNSLSNMRSRFNKIMPDPVESNLIVCPKILSKLNNTFAQTRGPQEVTEWGGAGWEVSSVWEDFLAVPFIVLPHLYFK